MIQDSGITQKIKKFTDLLAWQESHKLVLKVYGLKFPKEEMFGLVSQMRRAAISITSNIAEGFGRQGFSEKVQFYYLSRGSLTELKKQLIASRDIGFISSTDFRILDEQMKLAHRLLQGLISKSKSFLNRES
ncbi:MAG: four helix bundle protein [Candidatus Taylorbacteria bacterium]|nr:four helix bundle protein [Candidatus Taylorbacteria bacterium]